MQEPAREPTGSPTGEQHPDAAIRVVRGNPDEQELAALISALSWVRQSTAGPAEPAGLSAWGAYWYRLGQRPSRGASGWRASALPR